jgi:hypothetical protein
MKIKSLEKWLIKLRITIKKLIIARYIKLRWKTGHSKINILAYYKICCAKSILLRLIDNCKFHLLTRCTSGHKNNGQLRTIKRGMNILRIFSRLENKFSPNTTAICTLSRKINHIIIKLFTP